MNNSKEDLGIRHLSWFLLGIVLLILASIAVVVVFAFPAAFPLEAVLLALLPVAPLILAVFFHPRGRTTGFPALLGGVLVYYIVFFSLFAYGPLGAPTVIQRKSFQSSNISEAQVELDLSTFNGQITVLPSDSDFVAVNATVKTLSVSSNSIQLDFNDTCAEREAYSQTQRATDYLVLAPVFLPPTSS